MADALYLLQVVPEAFGRPFVAGMKFCLDDATSEANCDIIEIIARSNGAMTPRKPKIRVGRRGGLTPVGGH